MIFRVSLVRQCIQAQIQRQLAILEDFEKKVSAHSASPGQEDCGTNMQFDLWAKSMRLHHHRLRALDRELAARWLPWVIIPYTIWRDELAGMAAFEVLHVGDPPRLPATAFLAN